MASSTRTSAGRWKGAISDLRAQARRLQEEIMAANQSRLSGELSDWVESVVASGDVAGVEFAALLLSVAAPNGLGKNARKRRAKTVVRTMMAAVIKRRRPPGG